MQGGASLTDKPAWPAASIIRLRGQTPRLVSPQRGQPVMVDDSLAGGGTNPMDPRRTFLASIKA